MSAVAASVPIVTSAAEFAEFARVHLPQPFAERWISLLRPAMVFPWDEPGPGSTEHIALSGGGEPLLPDDVEWPMFEGRVPMRFIADLDCAAITAAGGVELMPESGHLLFFCVDPWCEVEDLGEDWWGQVTPWTAGKVIYLPDGVPRRTRSTPPELSLLEPLELTRLPARAASTPPSLDAVWAERYFGAEARSDESPLWARDFELGIHHRRCYVQSGGHPYDVQRPPEIEAARDALGRDGIADPGDDAVLDEAERWRLLFQDSVDESGNMIGYWLARDDDLAAGRFDRVYFDSQR